eukprot:tig00001292_g8049.t1
MGNGASAVASRRKKQEAAKSKAGTLKAASQDGSKQKGAAAPAAASKQAADDSAHDVRVLSPSFPLVPVLLAVAFFGALAARPALFEALERAGLRFLRSLQIAHNPFLDAVCKLLSYMGFELYFVLVILWCLGRMRNFRAGVSYLTLILWTFYSISLLKSYFQRSRPLLQLISTTATRPRAADELEFSFPSGHSTGAVVTALFLHKLGYTPSGARGYCLIALAVAMLSGSRLYLGVHYPQDVVGGWLLGLAIVLLYDWREGPAVGQPPPGDTFAWRFLAGVAKGVLLTGLPMLTVPLPVLHEHGGIAFAAGGIAGIDIGEALRNLGYLSQGVELPWNSPGRVAREVGRRVFVMAVAVLFIVYCELSIGLVHPAPRAVYGAILCWHVTFAAPGLLYVAPLRGLAASAKKAK